MALNAYGILLARVMISKVRMFAGLFAHYIEYVPWDTEATAKLNTDLVSGVSSMAGLVEHVVYVPGLLARINPLFSGRVAAQKPGLLGGGLISLLYIGRESLELEQIVQEFGVRSDRSRSATSANGLTSKREKKCR